MKSTACGGQRPDEIGSQLHYLVRSSACGGQRPDEIGSQLRWTEAYRFTVTLTGEEYSLWWTEA